MTFCHESFKNCDIGNNFFFQRYSSEIALTPPVAKKIKLVLRCESFLISIYDFALLRDYSITSKRPNSQSPHMA